MKTLPSIPNYIFPPKNARDEKFNTLIYSALDNRNRAINCRAAHSFDAARRHLRNCVANIRAAIEL